MHKFATIWDSDLECLNLFWGCCYNHNSTPKNEHLDTLTASRSTSQPGNNRCSKTQRGMRWFNSELLVFSSAGWDLMGKKTPWRVDCGFYCQSIWMFMSWNMSWNTWNIWLALGYISTGLLLVHLTIPVHVLSEDFLEQFHHETIATFQPKWPARLAKSLGPPLFIYQNRIKSLGFMDVHPKTNNIYRIL